MKKIVLILTILLFATSGLFAQSGTKILKKKQAQQLKKIENGIKSSEITKVEAKMLDRRIYKEKHDKQKRKK